MIFNTTRGIIMGNSRTRTNANILFPEDILRFARQQADDHHRGRLSLYITSLVKKDMGVAPLVRVDEVEFTLHQSEGFATLSFLALSPAFGIKELFMQYDLLHKKLGGYYSFNKAISIAEHQSTTGELYEKYNKEAFAVLGHEAALKLLLAEARKNGVRVKP